MDQSGWLCSASADKPLISVALAPESADAEAFGVTADDLQSNLAVSGDQITGTLKNISDGTVWDSGTWDEGESTGHFLFVKATDIPEGAVATLEVYGGTHGPTALSEDLNGVVRITDKDNQKLILTVAYEGVREQKIYGLKGLTLAE